MQPLVFHAKKKTLWQPAAGALALAVLMLVLGALTSFVLELSPGFAFLFIILFFLFFFGGMVALPSVFHPMELLVDDGGLELRARGKTTRIHWNQLEDVRIVHAPGTSKGDWLMAWPKSAPMQFPKRLHHPEWSAEHAAVKVCDLDTFQEDPQMIRDAVRDSAGPLWNDSATPR